MTSKTVSGERRMAWVGKCQMCKAIQATYEAKIAIAGTSTYASLCESCTDRYAVGAVQALVVDPTAPFEPF